MQTYHIKTFGCQMNKSDSERIATIMDQAGYKSAPLNGADLVIFNTCSVRQMAEDRAIGQVREAKKRGQKTIITGCLKNQEGFVPKHKEVDIFIDIHDIADLPKKLVGAPGQAPLQEYFDIEPKHESPAQAYIPIMTGCNNFCSYCIVPHVRGEEQSRTPDSIMKEIKDLVSNGCKQITLLGQNVNSYEYEGTSFPDLLERIAKLEEDLRIFFVTSHPKDLDFSIIELVKKYDKLCPYFHLPIQSGSDRILQKMNRKYNCKKYLEIVAEISQQIPEAAITTDIIVGYPGESKADFQKTVDLCKQVKYDLAYIARFSPRPQTAAAKVKDDVPPQEKKEREKILTEIVTKTALEQNQKQVSRISNVLVESSKQDKDKFQNYGKNEYFKTVKFTSDKSLKDQMVAVKITEAMSWGLFGQKKK
ncbi:tRNA (N6-isopentenyl adenosine(37)-C2)-methylthiotransferase MiaB [Patescibacteria group bacterium]